MCQKPRTKKRRSKPPSCRTLDSAIQLEYTKQTFNMRWIVKRKTELSPCVFLLDGDVNVTGDLDRAWSEERLNFGTSHVLQILELLQPSNLVIEFSLEHWWPSHQNPHPCNRLTNPEKASLAYYFTGNSILWFQIRLSLQRFDLRFEYEQKTKYTTHQRRKPLD